METPCKHFFCQTCAEPYIKKEKSCPYCMSTVELKDCKTSDTINMIITKLEVYCTRKDKGCKWIGMIMDYEDHTNKKCEYQEISCENNGCDKKFLRIEKSKHDCEYKVINCENCNKNMIFKNLLVIL
jgi:hypothetical protein